MGDPDGELYIIIYGADITLLKTRQWVLETGGFKVATAARDVELEHMLNARPTALLLLCHSLTLLACEQAVNIATIVSPQTRRLILDGEAAQEMKSQCDATFDAKQGPLTLIQFVMRMIGTPLLR